MPFKRDLFFTTTHEWIKFQNIGAFIGISSFRLANVKKIKDIEFVRVYGFKKKREVLANIRFNNSRFQVHMPVDGNIISINDTDLLLRQDLLLTNPETDGWLVKILVSQPCDLKGLLTWEDYSSTFSLDQKASRQRQGTM